MFLHLDSHSLLERTKPIVVGVDTHMEFDEVHGCPGRDSGGGFIKGPMLQGLQGEGKLDLVPKPTLPPSRLTPFVSSSHMEDHGFPARRNGLTQASFIYQMPAGWGSPGGFFPPCRSVPTPVVLKPPLPPCPISWGEPGPPMDGSRRGPA
uniref:Uncharacterized protein n=1 Tax=Chlorocebus sabaeus TaxID=60711 RepID=A0A0D9R9E2_CHLSB